MRKEMLLILLLCSTVMAVSPKDILDGCKNNIVNIPCGQYEWLETLTLKNVKNCIIDGHSCVTIIETGRKGQSVRFQNTEDVTLRNIAFDLKNNTGGILCQNCTGTIFYNVKVTNTSWTAGTLHCIDFTSGSKYNLVADSDLSYCSDDGIATDGTGVDFNVAFRNHIYELLDPVGGSSGVESNDGSNWTIAIKNTINHTQSYCLTVKAHKGLPGSSYNIYAGNVIEDGEYGVGISNVNGAMSLLNSHNFVIDNTILNPRKRGIQVAYAIDTFVSGNRVYGNPSFAGIAITGNTSDTSILKNELYLVKGTTPIRQQGDNINLIMMDNPIEIIS